MQYKIAVWYVGLSDSFPFGKNKPRIQCCWVTNPVQLLSWPYRNLLSPVLTLNASNMGHILPSATKVKNKPQFCCKTAIAGCFYQSYHIFFFCFLTRIDTRKPFRDDRPPTELPSAVVFCKLYSKATLIAFSTHSYVKWVERNMVRSTLKKGASLTSMLTL